MGYGFGYPEFLLLGSMEDPDPKTFYTFFLHKMSIKYYKLTSYLNVLLKKLVKEFNQITLNAVEWLNAKHTFIPIEG